MIYPLAFPFPSICIIWSITSFRRLEYAEAFISTRLWPVGMDNELVFLASQLQRLPPYWAEVIRASLKHNWA